MPRSYPQEYSEAFGGIQVFVAGEDFSIPGTVTIYGGEMGAAVSGDTVTLYGGLKVKTDNVPNVSLELPPQLTPLFEVNRGVVLEPTGGAATTIAVCRIAVAEVTALLPQAMGTPIVLTETPAITPQAAPPLSMTLRRADNIPFGKGASIIFGQLSYVRK